MRPRTLCALAASLVVSVSACGGSTGAPHAPPTSADGRQPAAVDETEAGIEGAEGEGDDLDPGRGVRTVSVARG